MAQTSENPAPHKKTTRPNHTPLHTQPQTVQNFPPPAVLFQHILAITFEGIIVTNAQGEITYANQEAKRLLGLTSDTSTEHTYHTATWEALTLDGQPYPADKLPVALALHTGEAVVGLEHLIEQENGQTVILSVNAAPMHDEQATIIGCVASFRDITRLKQLELERTNLLLREQAAHAEAVETAEQAKAKERALIDKQRLQLAQRVGLIGTFVWDIQNNYIEWTPELEALYGLPPDGFEGKYENWASRVHPEDLQRAEESINTAIAGGPAYNVEFRVVWPNGSLHWLLAKGDITDYTSQNQPLRMIGINIDITERKEAEQTLAAMNQRLQNFNTNLEAMVIQRTEVLDQLNLELQRSNQELQDFAYVASHDLQEPLRKIQAFGNLLEEEYGEALGDGRSYLDRMRKAASRMRVLINDLLVFSRVTTKAQPFSTLDLNIIVQETIEDLENLIQTTGGRIEIANLPTIEADPRQMQQLFQNLLANALKFHKPAIPPIIKVSATFHSNPATNASECQLLIADNGIGFDEKYLDRIFTVFQRLHGRGEYEGTGIGLAVVRKIVERHGGSITAKSTIGTGTTFIVTLPLQHQ